MQPDSPVSSGRVIRIDPANATTDSAVGRALDRLNLSTSDLLENLEVYASKTSDPVRVPDRVREAIQGTHYLEATQILLESDLSLIYWCRTHSFGVVRVEWTFGIPLPIDCDRNGEGEVVLTTALEDIGYDDRTFEIAALSFHTEILPLRPDTSTYDECSVRSLAGREADTAWYTGTAILGDEVDGPVRLTDSDMAPGETVDCDSAAIGVGRNGAHAGYSFPTWRSDIVKIDTYLSGELWSLNTCCPRGTLEGGVLRDVDQSLDGKTPYSHLILTAGESFTFDRSISLRFDEKETAKYFDLDFSVEALDDDTDTSLPSDDYRSFAIDLGSWSDLDPDGVPTTDKFESWSLFLEGEDDGIVRARSFGHGTFDFSLPKNLQIQYWDMTTEGPGTKHRFHFHGIAQDFRGAYFERWGAQEKFEVEIPQKAPNLGLIASSPSTTEENEEDEGGDDTASFDMYSLGRGYFRNGSFSGDAEGYHLSSSWSDASRVRFVHGSNDTFQNDTSSFVLQGAHFRSLDGEFTLSAKRTSPNDEYDEYSGRIEMYDPGTDPPTYRFDWNIPDTPLGLVGDDGLVSEGEYKITTEFFRSYMWAMEPDAVGPETCILRYDSGACA